ncbi:MULTISPECIES: HD domain-containing protein [unclassified Streptomyces]|uniref:HD domain-containing protein n=1 Tax=unclassified Streptomyces TaxID=2593676 RepID=UPI002E344E8C|nr:MULTISPECIES: HD domain-containing protein [unclassified Streptomyces]
MERAYGHVRSALEPAIFNHSVRVWLLADHLARREGLHGLESEALAVACLFHDAGTAQRYDGPQRFEVEGADAARMFLAEHGAAWPEPLLQDVWQAIALHTSPGIAERMGGLTRLVRLGVLADFGRSDLIESAGEQLLASLDELPRLSIETVLGDAVVEQAMRSPGKAPSASWPGVLLSAHLADPHHGGVNPAF